MLNPIYQIQSKKTQKKHIKCFKKKWLKEYVSCVQKLKS